MKHAASMAAGVAFSLGVIGAFGDAHASSYDVTAYTLPAAEVNHWTVSASRDPATPPWGPFAHTFELSNSETGATSTVTWTSSTDLSSVQTNARGDLLVTTQNGAASRGASMLWSSGQLQYLGSQSMNATLNADGSVNADNYFWDYNSPISGYAGGLYTNGRWYYVAKPYAPGASITNDVNSTHWTTGTVNRGMIADAGTTAAIGSPTGEYTRLPGVTVGGNGFTASANSINDSRMVVGKESAFGEFLGKEALYGDSIYQVGPSFATIWDGVNGSRDLNTLIDPTSALYGKVHLSEGIDIDNAGNIVATGYWLDAPGQAATFHLSAVPEASTMAMMSMGMLALLGLSRRTRH